MMFWCSFCPCMSTRYSEISWSFAIGICVALAKLRPLPLVYISRRSTRVPSSQSMPDSSRMARTCGTAETSNAPSSVARSKPERIWSVVILAPSTPESASIRMDFPAPVSPVRMFSPGPKGIFSSSIITKFFMRSSVSMSDVTVSVFAPAEFSAEDFVIIPGRVPYQVYLFFGAADADLIFGLYGNSLLPVDCQ
ncbi:MAG: hypothetical protein BWY96_03137 [Spirochaetes bacterium ADurb.BinA120]|nr:MAG: hypothetical protein BWY96_03137 [Spirochaetes bacterium ADurb.BinA120]